MAPTAGDLDRAVEGVLARAERRRPDRRRLRDRRLPLRQAPPRPDRSGCVKLALPSHRGSISEDEVLEELARKVSPRVLGVPAADSTTPAESSRTTSRARRDHFEVPVDWRLTPPGFRNRALHAVARIPYGETRTYGRDREGGRQRAGLPRRRDRLRPQPGPPDRPLPPRRPVGRRDRQLRRRPRDEALAAQPRGRASLRLTFLQAPRALARSEVDPHLGDLAVLEAVEDDFLELGRNRRACCGRCPSTTLNAYDLFFSAATHRSRSGGRGTPR